MTANQRFLDQGVRLLRREAARAVASGVMPLLTLL